MEVTLSRVRLIVTPWTADSQPHLLHGNSPGKNTGVGCHAFHQGIFSTQGSNPGLPQRRWILYQLSHKQSPRILEWVTYPVSSGSFRSRS